MLLPVNTGATHIEIWAAFGGSGNKHQRLSLGPATCPRSEAMGLPVGIRSCENFILIFELPADIPGRGAGCGALPTAFAIDELLLPFESIISVFLVPSGDP